MIRLIKNPDIKLVVPKFTCDDSVIGSHLNEHPFLKCLNVYGFLAVIGRPGSGKTSFSISLITNKEPKIFRKTHEHIIIVMPKNSISSMEKNPFKQLADDNIYENLDYESINEIYGKLDASSKEDEKTLLFIDDQTASLKRSDIEEVFKKIIYNRRHLKCNIIITAQSYSNIPLDMRKNIQNLLIFKPAKLEMEKVFEENLEQNRKQWLDIFKYVYDEPRNFLFIHVPTQKMFKNYDEIVVEEEEPDNRKRKYEQMEQ
jgi:GTPase SAR1 family protein